MKVLLWAEVMGDDLRPFCLGSVRRGFMDRPPLIHKEAAQKKEIQSIAKKMMWKILNIYNMHKNKTKKTYKNTTNIYLKALNTCDIIKIQIAIDCEDKE